MILWTASVINAKIQSKSAELCAFSSPFTDPNVLSKNIIIIFPPMKPSGKHVHEMYTPLNPTFI